jgi:hypothetical protein
MKGLGVAILGTFCCIIRLVEDLVMDAFGWG